MVCNVITADKANRLFWLGRYAERVYISLHLLRRYYDSVIDGDIANLKEYYSMLGVNTDGQDQLSREFQLAQLYSRENSCSIISSLVSTNDNAIVLRHDIKSESLSYIQMSIAHIEECGARGEDNITLLQPVTDYMLAFFGSIDERIFDERTRKFLRIGRLIENIDLHIRFRYPFFRIEEAFLNLKESLKIAGAVYDTNSLEQLDDILIEASYRPDQDSYRIRVLNYLNTLLLI
ncbi:MAG: alpha-E domain-containing protein [Rikenellaceae bacterium]